MKHVKRKISLVALAVGALVVAWLAGLPELLSGLQSGDSGLSALGWPAIVVYVLVFVGLGAVGVPPVIFMVPARFVWSDITAISVSLAGGMGAALAGFWLSRYLARDALSKRIPQRFHRYDRHLQDHGFKTVIALRLLFFLMPPVNWLLGLSRLHTGTFILATFIGALPGTIFFTFVGKSLVEVVLEGRPVVILVIVGLIAAAAGAWLIGAKLLGNGDEAESDSDREGLLPGLFWETIRGFLWLTWRTFMPPRGAPRPSLKRLGVMVLFFPLFAMFLLLHWLAFFIDECFFSRYHEVAVKAPLFVVGIPRSGTTFLHRVLAKDRDQYTVFSLWELVFAPSIIERKIIRAFAAADRHVGRPLQRLIDWLERRFAAGLADVHRLSLTAAEEDFVLLLPILACFILIVPFPFAEEIQNLAFFDDRLPTRRKRTILTFYRRLLQKHLYVNGSDRIILSKNVSFTPLLRTLIATFPDSKIVACVRDPSEAVPSQISSMRGSWHLFGNDMSNEQFRDRWLDTMHYSYHHLAETLDVMPRKQCYLVDMTDLQRDLYQIVSAFYSRFGLAMSTQYSEVLQEEQQKARTYTSRHAYAPEDFDLTREDLVQRYSGVYKRLTRLTSHPQPIAPP